MQNKKIKEKPIFKCHNIKFKGELKPTNYQLIIIANYTYTNYNEDYATTRNSIDQVLIISYKKIKKITHSQYEYLGTTHTWNNLT